MASASPDLAAGAPGSPGSTDRAAPGVGDATPLPRDAAAETAIGQRVEAEQLRIIAGQLSRLPVALLAANLFTVWLLWRADLALPACVWFGLSLPLEAWRFVLCRREHAVPSNPAAPMLRRLSILFAVLSVLRASMVPFVFGQPISDTSYVYTMLTIGLAAGGVATSGGVMWAYQVYALTLGGSLTVAWLRQGGFDGIGVGVLTALLFVALSLYVRDQTRMLRQLVALAYDNEQLVASLRFERDRAEAASLAKTRFFAAASHDLRQPLHALSINATTLELLARRQADPLIGELSHSITNALGQSNSLLEGLLDISRLDAGAVRPEMADVDALVLLRAVRDEFAPVAAQNGLTLELDLPDPQRLPLLRTDRDLLLRILNNLVSNALKFTRTGGVTLTVRTGIQHHGPAQRIDITVADTGPGIALAEQERVFEEFYQIGNPSRDRNQGLGLGLSIVQRTARLLGITIRLDSAPGAGTRVVLGTPAVPRPADAPATRRDVEATVLPAGLRVLVIDDEDEVVKSLLALLPMLGCEVRGASGSAPGLALLEQGFAPEVLIVDHRLRGESGFEAIARLRDRAGPVPAIVVTGDTAPENIRRAQASGFRVLHKPVDGARLAAALGAAINQALPDPA